MLGEAGATVYCTGRSIAGRPPVSEAYAGRPETIEQTAAQVTAHGGCGLAVRVDHASEADVAALGERIEHDHGRLDILVLDFWGDESHVPFGTPFWEIPLPQGRATIEHTRWPHVLTLQRLVPTLLRQRAAGVRGLVVEVTDGPALNYRASLFFDLASTLRARLAFAVAEELAPHGITAVAVTPGYMRTERTLDMFGVTEANWRDAAARDANFLASETPSFIGRGIAALAADPGSASLQVVCTDRGSLRRNTASPTSTAHARTLAAISRPSSAKARRRCIPARAGKSCTHRRRGAGPPPRLTSRNGKSRR